MASVHGVTTVNSASGSTITANRPTRSDGTALQVGDLILALVAGSAITPVTATGWSGGTSTELGTTSLTYLWRRVEANEPTSYTFTKSGTNNGWTMTLVAVVGAIATGTPTNIGHPGTGSLTLTTPTGDISATDGNLQFVVSQVRSGQPEGTTTVTPDSVGSWFELSEFWDGVTSEHETAYREVTTTGQQGIFTWTTSKAATAAFRACTFEVIAAADAVPPAAPTGLTASAVKQ